MLALLSACVVLQGERELVRDRVVIEIERRTPELEQALAGAGVTALRPVFHAPPRGWRNDEAAHAAALDRWFVARFEEPRDDVVPLALALARLRGVVSCSATRTGFACSRPIPGTIPDDPDFPNQWALQPGFMDAPSAWDVATTTNRIVAVIDNGSDLSHPELQPSLWTNPGEIAGNGVDDDGNGFVDDVHGWNFLDDDDDLASTTGHGTRVSGVIAAAGDNGVECAGVCWAAPLLFARIYDVGGATLTVDNAAAAIVYAAEQGAAVAQMAWGFDQADPVLRAAVDYALANDVLLVSLPGNFGGNVPIYPAAWDDVIGTIATDNLDRRANWSSYGDWNELAAPGDDVYVISVAGRARMAQGTSFASAHVSGAAALVRGINQDLDWQETQIVLQQSARDLGPPGFDADFGWGRLDLAAAVRLATTLHVAPRTASPGDDVTITLDLPAEPGRLYTLFPTRNGRLPGIPLASYDPTDARTFPLNYDDLLFPLVLGALQGGDALFDHFVDTTDPAGHATATFHLPRGPIFLGTDLDLAACLFDPTDVSHVVTMTCTARLQVR